jgi:hypothetical protein
MQNHLILKSCLATCGLALAIQTGLYAQTTSYNPIALTPGSFTQEIVVPTNWTYKLNNQSVTVTIDHGPSLQVDTVSGYPTYYSVQSGDCFFEMGLDRTNVSGSTNWGMPHGGTVLTNTTYPTKMYQLPYWTNYNSNCICIGPFTNGNTYNSQPLAGGPYVGQSYYTNVNLTLNNTSNFTALSLLCSGGGPDQETVTISYADGTVQGPVQFSIPNWFVNANTTNPPSGQVGPTASYAYTCSARMNPAENANRFDSQNVTSGTRLWSVDIALRNSTSPATNLSFSTSYFNAAGHASVIFAVSGSINPADNVTVPNTAILTGPFTNLIPVTGYNAGCVVANSPQNLVGLAPLTATMDYGTNLTTANNTWFEQGWDQAAPTNGFPVHGTRLTNVLNATNWVYQMPASYQVPMSVLIDVNHKSNNITPQVAASYSAFSLLTAGATIGSGKQMTNYIILQHNDGVNESNIFIGYDWFESTVTPAYIASERVNIGTSGSAFGREVQNLDGGYPKMFNSVFAMSDATPVTNIIVGYLQVPAAAATTYVIAVSGTTNFVPPGIATYTPAQNVYAGQTAVYSVTLTAGLSPSYQWQVTDGSTFTNNLNNGATGSGSTISGATTANLTIANVGTADTNYLYTCLAYNPGGGNNSIPALLTLLVSTNPPIVLPADSISDFYGSGYTPGEAYPSPAGLTLRNAIDETLACYLNYGGSGTNTSFQGPIGIIVRPSAGSSIVSALRFVVAENAVICDPADYELEGSPDGINWTTVVPYTPLSLPNQRNLSNTGAVNITNQVLQEVDFANTTSYPIYRLTIQNVKGGASANSMQIAEIQFLGTLGQLPPGIVQQPYPPTQQLQAGGNLTWFFVVNGPGPITYQWYQGSLGNPVLNATNSSYSTGPITQTGAGPSYFCVASNPNGSATSSSVTYTVNPASTVDYVSTVVADGPIAFLRLDEGPNSPPNNGTIAYDMIGGHDGIYSNTVLQANPPGSYSTNDPDQGGFAEFGQIQDPNANYLYQDNYVGGISNINFGTPTNTSTNFSVEAWVYLNTNTVAGAGIVASGWGGNEQFALDAGGTGNAFRFYFRTAGSNAINVSPNVTPSNSVWYHVVGVLNESSNVESLYVNGALAATNTTTTNAFGLGVLNTNSSISIGARPSGSATNYNFQLNGVVANVAIYPYALSGAQISNHYNATLMAPGILTQPYPAVQDMQVGGSNTWSIVAYGPKPITYQWYVVNTNNNTTNMITGATNASYTLTGATLSTNGYFCAAINPYGSTNSALAFANVLPSTSPYVSTVLADSPMAFYRLDEGMNNPQPNPPCDGVMAYDSVGGHNGFYTNSYLVQTPYSPNDSDNWAAEFGLVQDTTVTGSPIVDNYVGGINGINFSAPTNSDSSFSVEAWVNLHGNSTAGAGIVSKGIGGSEEFALDMGGTGNAFRFYFRTANTNSPASATPNAAPATEVWYHVVGVLYESNNIAYEYLYTNGVLVNSQVLTYTSGPGVYSNDTAPVVIGSRIPSGTIYSNQLNGVVANVAIYNYALSSNQVVNHYLSSGIAPSFTVVPTNVTVAQGGAPAVFHSSAFGTSNALSPMMYVWTVNGYNLIDGPSPIPGSTATITGSATPNLTVSGATLADNGENYTVTVTNYYNAADGIPAVSAQATLLVTASPQLLTDLQTSYTAFASAPFSMTASFFGSLPLNYQWTYNGNPISNGPRISGATSNTLTINPVMFADAGTYQLTVNNSYPPAVQTSPAVVTVLPILTFNGLGSDWSANGASGGGYISANTLELTTGTTNEDRGSFFSYPVYVGGFKTTFTYTDLKAGGYGVDADGACFVIQNDPRGAAALGGGGGSLGYSVISNSVALEFNLYAGQGIFFGTNGAVVATPKLDTDVELASGDPINVTNIYSGGVLSVFVEDTITGETFSMTTNVNIPGIVGTSFAYVGFTGSDGGSSSIQQISNFQYTPLVNLTAQDSGANLVLSWPALSGVYQLQSSSSVSGASWVNVTNAVSLINDTNQVTLPLPGGSKFYRLQLQ